MTGCRSAPGFSDDLGVRRRPEVSASIQYSLRALSLSLSIVSLPCVSTPVLRSAFSAGRNQDTGAAASDTPMDQSPSLASGSEGNALDALIQRAQGGDLTAFNSLVVRFQDPLYSLALRMLGSPQAAEDATQEAFIRAWRRIDSFKGGRFQSWLFTIVANLSRDELRRRARRPQTSLAAARDDPARASLDPIDDDPLPEERAQTGDLRATLERALAQLPDDWREIVVLSDVNDLAYHEIARITDLPLGTVKSRLSRARGRLRDILRESGELETTPDRSEVRR